MQSQPEKSTSVSQTDNNTSFFQLETPIIKILAIGISFILLIAVFFTITRGSNFCVFTIGSCTDISHAPVNEPITVVAAVAGITASVALTFFELPAAAAVGVGLIVWWLVNSLVN